MRGKKLIIIASVLILLAGGVIYYKNGDSNSSQKSGTSSTHNLSEKEKTRIREFWASFNRAQSLKLKGHWKEAMPYYRRAIELDEAHEDALYNMANCNFELNQFDNALTILKKLVQVNPMSHRGYRQIGAIYSYPLAGSIFDLKAAEAALDRAFEINKEETGVLLLLGELALVMGDQKKAFERFSLVNRSNFRAVAGYYLRAYMHWKNQRIDEASKLLEKAFQQSIEPKVVPGIPGEGDTHPGFLLPPTTLSGKKLIKPFWKDLNSRQPEERITPESLDREFRTLDDYLIKLQMRI